LLTIYIHALVTIWILNEAPKLIKPLVKLLSFNVLFAKQTDKKHGAIPPNPPKKTNSKTIRSAARCLA
jgi:hypothetical protein